jgi:hypothetical protein
MQRKFDNLGNILVAKSSTNYGKSERESFELVWTCDEEREKSCD